MWRWGRGVERDGARQGGAGPASQWVWGRGGGRAKGGRGWQSSVVKCSRWVAAAGSLGRTGCVWRAGEREGGRVQLRLVQDGAEGVWHDRGSRSGITHTSSDGVRRSMICTRMKCSWLSASAYHLSLPPALPARRSSLPPPAHPPRTLRPVVTGRKLSSSSVSAPPTSTNESGATCRVQGLGGFRA